jgi:signal transduction histidine kinase
VKKLKMGFFLIFVGLGLLISLSVCFLVYLQFRSHIKRDYYETLANVALMVEKQYPILYDLDRLRQGAQNDEDWFWEANQKLTDIVKAFNLAYIYYIETDGAGGYVFRMSSYVSREQFSELLGTQVWTDTPVPQEAHKAWHTQEMIFSPQPQEEEWGILVWALLPVVKDGETIGLVGVDYDISFINALQNRVLMFLLLSFIAAAVLTGLIAFFGSHSIMIPIKEQEKMTADANEHNKKIESLMKALKAALLSKSDFMAGISNGMSTPISNIIRSSSLLIREKSLTDVQRKNLEIINDSGQMLIGAINDILAISKLEAGRMEFRPVLYALPEMIAEISSPYITFSEKKSVRFILTIDDKLPRELIGDDLHIKHICRKLLASAFKFTDEGNVTFSMSFTKESGYVWLIIKVSDTGRGILQQELDMFLSDYGQINVAEKLLRGGTTGLGLYIIRRLAEMMKGSFTAFSELGEGSVFTVRLPQKAQSNDVIGPSVSGMLENFQYSG